MLNMNKLMPFRHWIQLKWYEHKDEIFHWEHRNTDELPEIYFKKYRWYLKALYKHEMKQQNV